MYSASKVVPFTDIIGKTLDRVEGLEQYSDTVKFYFTDNSIYQMHYYPDCCASCSIEDVDGAENLMRSVVLDAEEVTNRDDPSKEEYPDSYTWTYYKIKTTKGYVTIRWYGASNGYYSESCDFERIQ